MAWGNVDGCRARLDIDVMVRLREHVEPLVAGDGSVIGTATLLDPTGSTVRNRYRNVCTGGSASGSGTTTVTRNDVKGGPGLIYRNTRNVARRTANGVDLQERSEFELVVPRCFPSGLSAIQTSGSCKRDGCRARSPRRPQAHSRNMR